jgi:ABC-type polysaccharide/polyol phosphate export permease
VPPVIFAFSAALSGAVNFLLALVPLLAIQLALGVGVPWTILFVPLLLTFLLAMIAGIGLFLSTFAIRFDDVLNFVNNAVLVLVAYATPVFYPVTIVPAEYRKLFYLNPMYSYVTVFRYLDYGGTMPSWHTFTIVLATGIVGLAVGLWVFVRRWPSVAVLL